jgi:hypothetical protein
MLFIATMLISYTFTVISISISSVNAWNSGSSCYTFTSQVTVVTLTYPPVFPLLQDQYQAVALLLQSTSRTPPPPTAAIGPPQNLTKTFQINLRYCPPSSSGTDSKVGTLLLLTHGLGFDKRFAQKHLYNLESSLMCHSYWSFEYPKSNPQNYSFTYHAASSSFGTLSYDRLGCGLSSYADPYRSLLSNALAASAPSLSDGVILTGFSHMVTYQQWFLHLTAYHLASLNQPSRFGKYSSGFLTLGDKYYNQYSFLTYPFFDPGVLDQAEALKWPFTLGEFLTSGLVPIPSPNFTKPALVCVQRHGNMFDG